MPSLTKGNVKTAFHSLRRNKTRSLLTMLGVIIGVTSVVTVVSIGEGVKQQVNAQTEHLGKDLITVRPGQLLPQTIPSELSNLGLLSNVGTVDSLSSRDVNTVQRVQGVKNVAPLSVVDSNVVSGETHKPYNALVLGTNTQLPSILRQGLAYGSFFGSSSDSADMAVIGQHVAQVLFDENVPLGQTLNILGQQFVVAGIFNNFQTAPLSVDVDFNNTVFIPYTTAGQITDNNSPIYEILARPDRDNQTNHVVSRIDANLQAANGGQRNFTVSEQSRTLMVTGDILNLLTALIGGVAAIALLVGGIGIMNVMLVSIAERMQEIGIRKAVGATNRQILFQFMTEAAVLSVSGGFIGILLSLFINICLRIFTNLAPAISWPIIILAFLVSVCVGLLFGSVPALQAARKDPIEALRNE
ncbi:MAG: ABC transporter permease [Candidatus Saccharimonadales bacterium]